MSTQLHVLWEDRKASGINFLVSNYFGIRNQIISDFGLGNFLNLFEDISDWPQTGGNEIDVILSEIAQKEGASSELFLNEAVMNGKQG